MKNDELKQGEILEYFRDEKVFTPSSLNYIVYEAGFRKGVNWNTRTEPKEQDVCPVDKIREAFEEEYAVPIFLSFMHDRGVYKLTPSNVEDYEQQVMDHIVVNKQFGAYRKAYKSQQAEIDSLQKLKGYNSDLLNQNNELTAEIERLKAENEDLRNCLNCKNECLSSEGPVLCSKNDKGIVSFDHWQPKENN